MLTTRGGTGGNSDGWRSIISIDGWSLIWLTFDNWCVLVDCGLLIADCCTCSLLHLLSVDYWVLIVVSLLMIVLADSCSVSLDCIDSTVALYCFCKGLTCDLTSFGASINPNVENHCMVQVGSLCFRPLAFTMSVRYQRQEPKLGTFLKPMSWPWWEWWAYNQFFGVWIADCWVMTSNKQTKHIEPKTINGYQWYHRWSHGHYHIQPPSVYQRPNVMHDVSDDLYIYIYVYI